MFHQHIEAGHQVEAPDHWLRDGNLWEIERPEDTKTIRLYGYTERYHDADGIPRSRWVDTHDVLAVPYDMPIPGYRNETVNTLRLWKATATDAFDLEEFNAGSYPEAVAQKNNAEQISMVLYPNDASENGKELRLKQQYFSGVRQPARRDCQVGYAVRRGLHRFRTQELFSAERHSSGLCRSGTDASVDGRTRLGMGCGLENHDPVHGLYESHAAARSTGTLVGVHCSAACCRDCWRSSTRSTSGSWPKFPRSVLADVELRDRVSLIEEGRPSAHPHGLPGASSAVFRSMALPRCTRNC